MESLIVMAGREEMKILESLPSFFNSQPILITGVGAINIIRLLSSLPKDTHLINIGYAGAKNIKIGTLVEVTEVKLNHPAIQYPEPELPLMPVQSVLEKSSLSLLKVPCYSSTDFVSHSEYDHCVFDMELAYIAALGFPTTSIKMVSDNLSHEQYTAYAQPID